MEQEEEVARQEEERVLKAGATHRGAQITGRRAWAQVAAHIGHRKVAEVGIWHRALRTLPARGEVARLERGATPLSSKSVSTENEIQKSLFLEKQRGVALALSTGARTR